MERRWFNGFQVCGGKMKVLLQFPTVPGYISTWSYIEILACMYVHVVLVGIAIGSAEKVKVKDKEWMSAW